ncbi:undecaprenyl-diphosphatase UppP [Candidatus Peregrinibacteria bacterium]|nr:undecaprenyl-diphosphatase UppP [Candidatus Peregrinibacteria bacterium]
MGIFEALFLGLLQGVTEFLPVSSSGHLVITENYLNLDVENLKIFDVMLHLGSLSAIIIYFWKDFIGLIKGFLAFLRLYKTNPQIKEYQQLIGYLIIATIPAVAVALLFGDGIDYLFRNVWYVGIFMIIVGEIFILAEKALKKYKTKKEIGFKDSIIIGCAQAAALIPGVSRSGSTISAGLFLGIPREKAARFSFLMAIPAILGAGIFMGIKNLTASDFALGAAPMITGFAASLVASFGAVYFLMRFLKKHTLRPFAYYLFALGGLIIAVNLL